MSIKSLEREEILEMSMIEVAYEILKEEKKEFPYFDLLKRVADIKEMTEEEMKTRIGYFYTNLNIDGRFVCVGENVWGLKAWYPIEKLEDEWMLTKSKKKATSIYDDEDELEDEDYEGYEDEEEYDEYVDEDVDEVIVDEDDSFIDEDALDNLGDDAELDLDEDDEPF